MKKFLAGLMILLLGASSAYADVRPLNYDTVTRTPYWTDLEYPAGDGDAAEPGFRFGLDTNTGIYRPGADQIGFSVGGAGELILTATAFSPVTSDGQALGTTTLMWSDLFAASGFVLNFNNGDVLVTHSANTLTFTGASSGYLFDAVLAPNVSDAAALGSATLMWSDLFLASGSVINWNNGDLSLTHSANTLTLTGGSLVAAIGSSTIDASGFNGNLATSDDTIQEIAQKLDDLVGGGGSGDVTAASTFGTDNRLIRSDGTSKGVQASAITVDDSGNLSTAGSISSGVGGSNAGYFGYGEGTAPSIVGNQVIFYGPADIDTAGYRVALPASPATGFRLWTDSSGTVTESIVGSTGSGNVVRVTSPTLVTPILGVAAATTLNTGFGDNELYDMDQNVQTSDSPQFAGLNIGHASDTTVTRSAAGKLAVEGVDIPTVSSSDTFTNKKTSLSAAHSTDDTYDGVQIPGLNNSGGVTQWDAVYLNGSSQWVLADANGSSTYPARGIAVATVATANATTVLVSGTIRNDAWAWTPGGTIYLSTTAGGLTQTAPSTSADKVQQVGFALTADIAYFNFASGEYLTVQ